MHFCFTIFHSNIFHFRDFHQVYDDYNYDNGDDDNDGDDVDFLNVYCFIVAESAHLLHYSNIIPLAIEYTGMVLST